MTQQQFPLIQKADLEWRDGLPVSKQYGDIYFSVEDGLNESRHVFLDGNSITERFRHTAGDFCLVETGFGSGLNALLTIQCWLREAPPNACLYYTSIEKHPLSKEDLARALSLWPELDKERDMLLAQYPPLIHGMHRLWLAEGRILLTLMFMDVVEAFDALLVTGHPEYEPKYNAHRVDAWYLDGFAPAKNSDMWRSDLFARMAMLSDTQTTLASFTVARVVKDALIQNGFCLEKRAGFGKKRECLRAVFTPKTSLPNDKTSARPTRFPKAHTPWHLPEQVDQTPVKRIAIIGAGLSGAMLAYALRAKGHAVQIFESGSAAASGGSGNPQAVLYPRFSAYRSPLLMWLMQAYLYAKTQYPILMQNFAIPGSLEGLVMVDDSQDVDYQSMTEPDYAKAYAELLRMLDAEGLSSQLGVALHKSGVFVQDAGWLDARVLCERLLEASKAELFYNTPVRNLQFDTTEAVWQIDGFFQADAVILCNAASIQDFAQTSHLAIKSIPGQLSFIEPVEPLRSLRLPLCGDGHVLPVYEGRQALGATYHPKGGVLDKAQDNRANLAKLGKLGFAGDLLPRIVDSWAAARAATPDYLPLVGPIADPDSFTHCYARFAKNAREWIPAAPDYYPQLYAMAGFGSRGLTSIPLAAEYLKNMLLGEPTCLPRQLQQAVSPQRFLYKALCRGQKN